MKTVFRGASNCGQHVLEKKNLFHYVIYSGRCVHFFCCLWCQ